MKNNLPIFLIAIKITITLCTLSAYSQTITPEKQTGKSKYIFKNELIYFEVDTSNGARISSLKWKNNEILYLGSTSNMNGSTFWPSPQSLWNWPPLAAIDSKPYSVRIQNNKLITRSSLDTKFKLRVYKSFLVDERDTSITITYYMKNENTKTLSFAPWEVTRIPLNGIVFFEKGETTVSGSLAESVIENNGCYWYDQVETTASSSISKFFSDGKGWLAYINDQNILFLKKFDNILPAEAAANEAEIEVYTASDHSYTEIENQGKYQNIAINDSVAYKVKWYVREIPDSVVISVGSSSLINFARYIANLPNLPDTTTAVTNVNQNNDKNNSKFIWVNSTNKILKIKGVSNNEFPIQVYIYNSLGKIIMHNSLNEPSETISLLNLPAGVYFCKIKGKFTQPNVSKFVINQ